MGSVITWGIELWRARRQDSDEGRVAARLVIDELQSIANARTAEEPEFRKQRDLAMEQDAWRSYRSVLARELTNEQWRSVRIAYDALASPQRSTAGERHVDESWAKAMEALEPLASKARYWWQRLRP